MKFTDSPVIELKVGDSLLSLQQDNGSFHVGTSVWPCSLVLVKFAERWISSSSSSANPNPYSNIFDFRNKRGIELGAGCGAGGMGLYLLGLTDIVLTDIAPVMPALKRNIKRNKPVLKKSLKTAQLYWANSGQIKSFGPPFDVVIAADVVYLEETVKPLVETMEELIGENGVVLLGYQLRSPEADKLFWEVCENVFEIKKVPHEDLHPDYAYEEADIFIFTKKLLDAIHAKVNCWALKHLNSVDMSKGFLGTKAGGHIKVAWEKVCLSKKEGGLGFMDIGTWNILAMGIWITHQ